MAPLLDFELLMGEDRKDIWRDLCIKDAQTTADVSLVSRDHAEARRISSMCIRWCC